MTLLGRLPQRERKIPERPATRNSIAEDTFLKKMYCNSKSEQRLERTEGILRKSMLSPVENSPLSMAVVAFVWLKFKHEFVS